MPTLITAGDATTGLTQTGGNDGALTIQTGAAGSKVSAIALASDGTPTLIKGPTIGTAPTPVPTGTAPLYGCRAWCVFNGTTTGTNAPLAGGNVTSVTRNSTGNYTINFTTAMPDASYAAIANAQRGTSNTDFIIAPIISTPFTVSSATFQTQTATGAVATDAGLVSVAVFR